MVIAMNINEVYLRIIETENDSDVVKLAKKEVMVIPILINAMLDENNCRAQNIQRTNTSLGVSVFSIHNTGA